MQFEIDPVQLWNNLWTTIHDSRQGAKDVVLSAIPQLVGVLTGFFGSVFVARGLGPNGMGQYALVTSLAYVAMALSDLGIGQTAIRYTSLARAKGDTFGQMAVLRWALRWRLTLVMLVTAAFFLVSPFVATHIWHSEALTPYLRLGLLGGIFVALASVPSIYFQSVKRFGTNAAVTSAQRLITFSGILLLTVFSLWSLLNLIVVNLVASAICALVFIFIVPKAALWPLNSLHNPKGFNILQLLSNPKIQGLDRTAIDSTLPNEFMGFHMLSSIIVTLTLQVDVWLIGFFLTKSELGVYSAATKFTLPLAIVLGALTTALWPRASALTERQQLLKLFKRTLGLSILISFPIAIYSVCAPLLAPYLFGSAYEKSCLLGQVLSLQYCLVIVVNPIGIVGYSFGLVRYYWFVNLIQLIVVVMVNVILLPSIGPLASALALLANTIVGSLLFTLIIWWKIFKK